MSYRNFERCASVVPYIARRLVVALTETLRCGGSGDAVPGARHFGRQLEWTCVDRWNVMSRSDHWNHDWKYTKGHMTGCSQQRGRVAARL